VSIGCVGSGAAPQLQTAWTRAEAACAARHRGDAYYELLAPAPPAPADVANVPGPSGAPGASNAPATGALAPGFTLYM